MNLVERIFLSIKRRLGSTVILLAVTGILFTLVLGAISINRAVLVTYENLLNNQPSIVSFQAIPPQLQQSWDLNDRDAFVNTSIYKAGSLPYIQHFEYSFSANIHGLYIRRYQPASLEFGVPQTLPPGETFDFFTLQGVSQPEIIFIEAGQKEIVSGRTFTSDEIENSGNMDSNATVVSNLFAIYNGLMVGDIITISRLVEQRIPHYESITIDYELEIIGIWDYLDRQTAFAFGGTATVVMQEHFINTLLVPNWLVNQIDNDVFDYLPWRKGEMARVPRAFFVLENASYFETFARDATVIFPEGSRFDDHRTRFGAAIHTMDSLAGIIGTVMWGAIGASVLILALLILMLIKSRQHEIGIYLVLGEKKTSIMWQIVTEVLLIVSVGAILSFMGANIISTELSRSMFRQEMSAFNADLSENMSYETFPITAVEILFGFHEVSYIDMMEAMNINLNPLEAIAFYVVGLGTVALATAVPILYIVRMKPKKILL